MINSPAPYVVADMGALLFSGIKYKPEAADISMTAVLSSSKMAYSARILFPEGDVTNSDIILPAFTARMA